MKKKIFISILIMMIFVCQWNIAFAIDTNESFKIEKLIDNGADYNKLVFVIMGDGYTAKELTKFKLDATNLINGILSQEPFISHKKDINFYIINVISNVSGAATSPDAIIDNYFGSTFNFAYNIARLLAPTKTYKAYDCLYNSMIDYDKGFIIANSDTYGGSGGDICITSTNHQSIEIIMHELGHSLGGLGDEYFAGDMYTDEAPNITAESNPELVKWKAFIGKNNIGVYPMAETTGWYIPHLECKMKQLYAPFCDVCKNTLNEEIIQRTLFELRFQINNPLMTINRIEKEISSDSATTPLIINDRTMLPLRSVVEAIGGTVTWSSKDQKIDIKREKNAIELWIGSNNAKVNGVIKYSDVAPVIIGDRTFLPLRFIAESLNLSIIWDSDTQTITISGK